MIIAVKEKQIKEDIQYKKEILLRQINFIAE